jgi:hypothetical protein
MAKSKLLSVIGHTSGQLVKPKNIAVRGPSKDFSVIFLLFTSFKENEEPLKDLIVCSFFSFIDKNTGNIKNKNIKKQPAVTTKDVLIFIVE